MTFHSWLPTPSSSLAAALGLHHHRTRQPHPHFPALRNLRPLTLSSAMSPVQIPPTPPNGQVEAPVAHGTSIDSLAFSTRALHIGSEPSLSASSGVVPALDLSTTYQQSSVGQHRGFEYTRSSNPVRLALERQLASLEGNADALLEDNLAAEGLSEGWEAGPAALAFASGSAATATVVSGLAGRGGHIVS